MAHLLFAQITDLHITPAHASSFLGRSPEKQLHKIISYFNAMFQPPKFVFITGDCVDKGTKAEYAILRNLLSQLNMPYYLIPGNHDNHLHLREIFPEIAALSQDPYFIQWVIEDYSLRLVGVDTVLEKAMHGGLCEQRLAWLDRVLSESSKPTVLFMHHPPIACGIKKIDHYAYQGIEKLGEVLNRHLHVKHLFCGHAHRAMQILWEDKVVSVIGSTVAQMSPDSFADHPFSKWSTEPPAFALHWWQAEKQKLVTQFYSL